MTFMVNGTGKIGCLGSCEGTAAIESAPGAIWAAAQQVLSITIGTYGYIKQWQINERMVELAERNTDRADANFALTKQAYDTITVPSFNRMRDLYDRYTTFQGREDQYVNRAYAKEEYCPDYDLQEGRAISRAQVLFDKAALQQRRAVGKYNTGRACHNATYFAIEAAKAKTDAANIAYRYEDQKKIHMDEIYWKRFTQGAMFVQHLGDRGVTGLTGANNYANNALGSMTASTRLSMEAGAQMAGALANQSGMWGSIAQSAFKGLGYQSGMQGQQQQQQWGETYQAPDKWNTQTSYASYDAAATAGSMKD
jgi:hypothetical protein